MKPKQPIVLPFPFSLLQKKKKRPIVIRDYPNYALILPRFWHGYFYLLTALLGAANLIVLVRVIMAWGHGWSTCLQILLLSALVLWPLWSYAYQKKSTPRWLTQFFFWFLVIAIIVDSFFVLVFSWRTQTQVYAGVWFLLLILGLPYVFALHQYIFRSPRFWYPQAFASLGAVNQEK